MDFMNAVKTCFSKYATFSGRATRSEFWWWALFVLIASVAFGVLSAKLSAVFTTVTLVPYLAVIARRLHDTDRSGWMQLVALIPLIGIVILVVMLCQDSREPNRFG